MKEIIPLIRDHIVKAVTIGWVLGCLCIAVPSYFVLLIVSVSTEFSFSIGLTQIVFLPFALVVQGLLVGLIVRVGLSLYQFFV